MNIKERLCLALSALLMVILSACSDDDSNKNEKYFTLDEVKRPLSEAILYYGAEPLGESTNYLNRLLLINNGFEVVMTDGGGTEIDGVGDVVLLEMICSSQKLEGGTYTFTNDESVSQHDFIGGKVHLDFDSDSEGAEGYEFTAGTYAVTQKGTTYKVMLEGVIDADLNQDGIYEDVNVKLRYEGKIHLAPDEVAK